MTFSEAVRSLIFEKPKGYIIRLNEDGNEDMKGYFYILPAVISQPFENIRGLFNFPTLCTHSYISGCDGYVKYTTYANILETVKNDSKFVIVDKIYKNRKIPNDIKIKFNANTKSRMLDIIDTKDLKNGDHVFVKDFVDDEKKIVRHELIFTVKDENKLGSMDAFSEYQY